MPGRLTNIPDSRLPDVLPLDALLIDFDGTIVDTESTVLAQVWRETVGGVSDRYAVHRLARTDGQLGRR